MSTKRLPEGFSSSAARGTDGRHGATVANNHVGLPAALHIIQDLREPTRRISGAQLFHKNQIIRFPLALASPPAWVVRLVKSNQNEPESQSSKHNGAYCGD